MRVGAVIPAAGRGARAGGDVVKQYQMLAGRMVLLRTLDAFAAHPGIEEIVVVVAEDDGDRAAEALAPVAVRCVTGGATRAASVAAGLAALGPETTHVLVHDAARPLIGRELIDRVIAALGDSPGAAPALPVSDALWRGEAGHVRAAEPRAGLFRAETPQGFELAAIRAAHAAYGDAAAADDVEIALAHGLDVAIVPGDADNLKITRPEDFARAERLLRGGDVDVRSGNGVDVHRFGPGDRVVLCGVEIPHERGLAGHSDADAGLHALTDALYGALAEGDIGQHFPPDDPEWANAASAVFLEHAAGRAAARGFRIANADVTLIAERPKIAPHTEAMRAEIARLAGTTADRISVKATTSERLGFAGRGEGIAAMASVTLIAR